MGDAITRGKKAQEEPVVVLPGADPLLALAVKASINPGPPKRAPRKKRGEDPGVEGSPPPEKEPEKDKEVEEARPPPTGSQAWWAAKVAAENEKGKKGATTGPSTKG